jgi:hypothetical protein
LGDDKLQVCGGRRSAGTFGRSQRPKVPRDGPAVDGVMLCSELAPAGRNLGFAAFV